MSDNYKCVKCHRVIRKNQHAIMCDLCSRWTHRTCQTGVSRITYLKCVKDDGEIPFSCKTCKGDSTSEDSEAPPETSSETETASTSKGKGFKRKKATGVQENTSERIKRLRNERVVGLKDMIEKLSEEKCKELLFKVTDKLPAYVFDILEKLNDQDGTPDSPSPSSQAPAWCVCTHCVDMPTDLERLCCNLRPQNCICRLPEIDQYCLDPGVLDIADVYRRDVLVMERDEDVNRRRRHSAYRQFVMWRFGRLGTGNRVVIPSCVVNRVRRTFPDRNNQYTGFMVGRLL